MTVEQSFSKLSTIADTVSGAKAMRNPQETIVHYENLADHLWISSEVQQVADNLFTSVRQGNTAWMSLSGQYGFGKTSTAITLWQYARKKNFLAIPPLSCTGFDELAHAVVALAEAQAPKAKTRIRSLFKSVWLEGIEQEAKRDAERYELQPKIMRRLLEDKLNEGLFALDGSCHRFVEFLSKLGELATDWSNGLIIILDELQQLLGPLDARAIIQFREFVWGMRTERTSCGIAISLDAMLEARLSRWAGDILHRIRENTPALQMSNIYTREFPFWLWENLTTQNGSSPLLNSKALSNDVLVSLGQFMERPDLANGPRTVADVFTRANEHYALTQSPYEIPHLVEDIHKGAFRYFGENALVQTTLVQLLKEEWIITDEARLRTVSTLAAFPLGCPPEIWQKSVPSEKIRERVRDELFAPLLVELSNGLALEQLQQIRRSNLNWERELARSWETLPAFDALSEHTPNYIQRIFIPLLFPQNAVEKSKWVQISDDVGAALTNWHRFRGTFDDSFPAREIAIWVGEKEPDNLQRDADLCILFICDSDFHSLAQAELIEQDEVIGIRFRLPILHSFNGQLPVELERCRKYIQPQQFNLAIILHAIHELEAFIGGLLDDNDLESQTYLIQEEKERLQARTFVKNAMDFIFAEVLQGKIKVGKHEFTQRGKEVLHALFVQACRMRFGNYETLIHTPRWRENLKAYRNCLASESLNIMQQQGREEIKGQKGELLEKFFDQKSSAAGDSFLRLLGSLINFGGSPENFSIRLSLHPAETALLNYLKRTKPNNYIPFNSATEFLRHQGYLETEVEEIVALLADRELIRIDENNDLSVIQNTEIIRQDLFNRITETKILLRDLGENELDELLENSTFKFLQSYGNELEKRLQDKLLAKITQLRNEIDNNNLRIGTVSSFYIEEIFSQTEISQHLSGIAEKLKETKGSLIKNLRKESELAKIELKKSEKNLVEWVREWQKRQELFFASTSRLQKRVEVFSSRANEFEKWVALNQQLYSTRLLCGKLTDSEPEYEIMLDRLTDEWREKFASDPWTTVFNVDEFSKNISAIQSNVQRQIFSLSQAFSSELEFFRNEFGTLLIVKEEPPAFEVNSIEHNSIIQTFHNLYAWMLDVLRKAVENCQCRKESGERWSAPNSASWKELIEQINTSLENCSRNPDFNTVKNCATKLLKLVAGFASEQGIENMEIESTHFDNPDQPPDFAELEKNFRAGLIIIKIELRKK